MLNIHKALVVIGLCLLYYGNSNNILKDVKNQIIYKDAESYKLHANILKIQLSY